jgi:hypothetical protein
MEKLIVNSIYSITKFANYLPVFFHSNTQYIRLSDMQINRFFPLKLNKWFSVLQEYSIINNILLYDIWIDGVDYQFLHYHTI